MAEKNQSKEQDYNWKGDISMIMSSKLQHTVLLDICSDAHPELFLKLIGTDDDLEEFHHELWNLPFYQKLVQTSKNINTTKFLYLSDRLTNSSSLFYVYELSYSVLSLKGTYNIERRIIDIKENHKEFKNSLEQIINNDMANNVPSEIWNYLILL